MDTIAQTRRAYDALAPGYDDFNAANDYELWFSHLLPPLEGLGLPERGSLLDVGCGTGRAVEPMLRRGWEVTGVDLSPGMVDEARSKHAAVRFEVCDMRELPVYGSFELVWALNDPVNYLLGEDDLDAALRAMATNLADGGLLVFDCNTRKGMDALFGESEQDDRWRWEGFGGDAADIYAAELSGGGEAHVHQERYWAVPETHAAMARVGLIPVAAMGQQDSAETGLVIGPDFDEKRDHKVVHVAKVDG